MGIVKGGLGGGSSMNKYWKLLWCVLGGTVISLIATGLSVAFSDADEASYATVIIFWLISVGVVTGLAFKDSFKS